MNLDELDGIVESARKQPISEDDAKKLTDALHSMAEHFMPPSRSSEKTGDVFDGVVVEKEPDGGVKVRRPGHGRNGAAKFTGAKKVPVPHPELKSGSACPNAGCTKGKVYPHTARPLVRIVGQAAFHATVYECERLRCRFCGEIFTAPAPEGIGSERYDETVPAMVALLKYGLGMPFNRLEVLQKQLGVPLPASVQWALVEAAAQLLKPAHEQLVREAAQGEVLHSDDTSMRVLKLERPDNDRTGVFTSGVVATQGQGQPQIAVFMTGWRHAGENLADVLKHRAAELGPAIQMSDAASRNVPKLSEGAEILIANCLAHGRRHFVDVADNFPNECRHVLEMLGKVYAVDEEARKQELSPAERLKLHQERSEPVMKELKRWLTAQLDEKRTEPNSGLGKAMKYLLTHWQALTLFLKKAGAPLDNNICERALKKTVLHRKNALFYLSENGAQVGDLYMSLVHTCELNDVNAFEYLVALQRNAAQVKTAPQAWMPWNFSANLPPPPS